MKRACGVFARDLISSTRSDFCLYSIDHSLGKGAQESAGDAIACSRLRSRCKQI